jgi:hypothetical protein
MASVLAATATRSTAQLPDADGESPVVTRLKGTAAVITSADQLRYWVENGLAVRWSPSGAWYAGFEHTDREVFLDLDRAPPSGTIQLDRSSTLDMVHVGMGTGPHVEAGLALGYARADLADRPGSLRTAIFGPSLRLEAPSLHTKLAIVAGATAARRGIEDDSWTRLSVRTEIPVGKPSLGFEIQYEALGSPWPAGGYLRGGPFLSIPAGDVTVESALHYVRVDDQPLVTRDDRGWGFWLGLRGDGPRTAPDGFLLAHGSYRLGAGNEGETSRMAAEVGWRPSGSAGGARLEYVARTDSGRDPAGTYRVALGPTAHFGMPGCLGAPPREGRVALEFLHRSDHALDAEPERVALLGVPSDLGPMIEHTNVNIFPRLTLATDGWSLTGGTREEAAPWELFLAAGRRLPGHGHGDEFAGQAALRVNAVRGRYGTAYVQGVASTGGEAPEQAVELGWESGIWSVFGLWNDYGVSEKLGTTSEWVVGLGIRM